MNTRKRPASMDRHATRCVDRTIGGGRTSWGRTLTLLSSTDNYFVYYKFIVVGGGGGHGAIGSIGPYEFIIYRAGRGGGHSRLPLLVVIINSSSRCNPLARATHEQRDATSQRTQPQGAAKHSLRHEATQAWRGYDQSSRAGASPTHSRARTAANVPPRPPSQRQAHPRISRRVFIVEQEASQLSLRMYVCMYK